MLIINIYNDVYVYIDQQTEGQSKISYLTAYHCYWYLSTVFIFYVTQFIQIEATEATVKSLICFHRLEIKNDYVTLFAKYYFFKQQCLKLSFPRMIIFVGFECKPPGEHLYFKCHLHAGLLLHGANEGDYLRCPWPLPWCPSNAPVEIYNFLTGCPLPKRTCFGALVLLKTKHTGLLYAVHTLKTTSFAPGLGIGAPSKVPHTFSNESALCKMKQPCPLEDEIPCLLLCLKVCTHRLSFVWLNCTGFQKYCIICILKTYSRT